LAQWVELPVIQEEPKAFVDAELDRLHVKGILDKRYILQNEMGCGGNAKVWVASDTQDNDK